LAYVQYDARDKFLSRVVGGGMTDESVATWASAAGELRAKIKRIAWETPAICSEPSTPEMSLTSH